MKERCGWVQPENALCVRYHDQEWGRPEHDDRRLFEMLILECFQAGLSWECVLNKRQAFRTAFAGFDPETVARFGEKDVQRLKADASIIRHEGKIRAAICNAQAFLRVQQEYGSFDRYLWGWTQGKILHETGRTRSELSDALSGDLKKRGMKFVGSVTVYAYLQAAGLVYPHENTCFLAWRKGETK